MANYNLNENQKQFCAYYAAGESAGRAYMDAYGLDESKSGYARQAGWRLLQDDRIKELVRNMQHDIYEALCLDAEKIALKLASMAFAEKNDEDYTPQIQIRAIDLLQKQMGLQTQNLNSNSTTVITVTLDEDEENVERDS